jgi:RNA polymerase sigma-70 factor (ECF subfamily)
MMAMADSSDTASFSEEDLLACIPHLRAYARFLTGNRERADDLVQDALVRALTASHQFQPGTNLKAWIFTILRNLFYNEIRKNRLKVQSIDDLAGDGPATPATQEANLEFADFRRAFWQLGQSQREVLIMVGASGLSYDEAAAICNCAVGTIKSRVSRARRELLKILEDGKLVQRRTDSDPPTGIADALSDLLIERKTIDEEV